MVTYATDILQGLSVEAAGFLELAKTAESISTVVRFGNIRHLDSAPLLPVLNQMFLRACLVFLNSCGCDSQAEKGVMEAIERVNSLCLHHDFLDEERFIRLLAEAASRDDLNTGISAEEEGYIAQGFRVNVHTEKNGAERAVDMMIKKLRGEPYVTELPMPVFDRVKPRSCLNR